VHKSSQVRNESFDVQLLVTTYTWAKYLRGYGNKKPRLTLHSLNREAGFYLIAYFSALHCSADVCAVPLTFADNCDVEQIIT
jgi:hypothetical protein